MSATGSRPEDDGRAPQPPHRPATAAPRTLDRAALLQRLPHQGRMCLLDSVLDWDRERLRCRATGHADPQHPLRSTSGLLSATAIEYAAQAMALHAGLAGDDAAAAAGPGMLAGVRDVRLHVARLDSVAGALTIDVQRLRGDARQAIYAFAVHDDGGRALVDGRATVVLDAGWAQR